ncbi:MAG: hypothetical protein H6739_21590 [Alphaproteobacteria bacterium]|nr:hypothetical protein [Alphaproteobacteria bacterium]
MAVPDPSGADIDDVLARWQQGDCVVGDQWFLYRVDPGRSISATAQEACDPETGNVEVEVRGFAVLTQTCDLVRSCVQRPFVEVSPLEPLREDEWRAALRGRLPRFAVVPGLAEQRLAVDLDRVMTVEKSIVAGWIRTQGCRTDEEARLFALALARKRARFAFPDDFIVQVRPLQRRLTEKHDKQSDEGRALRALREIRVRAAPTWEAEVVELTFFFIRDAEDVDFEGRRWDSFLEAWLGRFTAGGRFKDSSGVVLALEDLSARDYVESDPLDLRYLSERSE